MRRLPALCVSLLIVVSVHAQDVEFTEHILTDTFNGANTLHVTDMDDDKDLDIIATAQTDGRITWWENVDSLELVFVEHLVGYEPSPSRVVGADLDMDGLKDVLCAFDYGDQIVWWRNLGDDQWQETVILSGYSEARQVEVMDMDDDGDMDIVTCGQWTVSWLENNGSEDFTVHTLDDDIPGTAMTKSMDYDNDGDIDIFAAAYWWGEAAYYMNTGGNSFLRVDVDNNLEDPHWIEPADLDLDGDMDLLVSSRSDNQIFWYEYAGASWPRHLITTGVNGPQGMAAGDFNGDGDWDFVAAGRTGGDLSYWDNNGLVFTGETIQEGLGMPSMAQAGNFDQDGDMDFVATYWGSNTLAVWENHAGDDIHPPNEIWIDLVPDAATTTVPPSGGVVEYDVFINNPLQNALSGVGWLTVEIPNNQVFTIPPVSITVPGQTTAAYPDRTMIVPGWAPAGVYTLTGYIGLNFPYPADDDSFEFSKLAAAGPGPLQGEEITTVHLDGRAYTAAPAQQDDSLTPVAQEPALSPAYPNPFNASTTVALTLPTAGHVELRLVDLQGRTVRTLQSGDLQPGRHRWTVDGSRLASGTYLLQARVAGEVLTRKLVLMK